MFDLAFESCTCTIIVFIYPGGERHWINQTVFSADRGNFDAGHLRLPPLQAEHSILDRLGVSFVFAHNVFAKWDAIEGQ